MLCTPPHTMLFFRALVAPVSFHSFLSSKNFALVHSPPWNLTPSFLRESLLIHEWLIQNARECGTEHTLSSRAQHDLGMVGRSNGEVVGKRELRVFDSSQILLPEQTSSKGQSGGSWHQIFLTPNELHQTHTFMCGRSTEPAKLR